jgi:Skp family chaperone for outer membrane proteins
MHGLWPRYHAGRAAVRALAIGAALALGAAHAVTAQSTPAPDGTSTDLPKAPLLTLDQDRLFAESLYGKAVQSRFETESSALIAENRQLEADLEREERELTDKRAKLPAAEFETLATAFDKKVEELRSAQDAKSRAVTRHREEERQRFFSTVAPLLGQLMQESGAVAIINKSALVLSFERIDMTDAAIARLDAVLGDGGPPDPSPTDTPPQTPPSAP